MSKIYEALLRAERDRAETSAEARATEAATAVLPGDEASSEWKPVSTTEPILPRPGVHV